LSRRGVAAPTLEGLPILSQFFPETFLDRSADRSSQKTVRPGTSAFYPVFHKYYRQERPLKLRLTTSTGTTPGLLEEICVKNPNHPNKMPKKNGKKNNRRNKTRGSKDSSAPSQALFGSNAGVILKRLSPTWNILPRSTIKTLIYTEVFNTTSGATGATGSTTSFALNSLFDPAQNIGGHQPYGFDQLAAWYKNYIVHNVAWELNVSTIGCTSEQIVCVGITASTAAATFNAIPCDAAMEKPMTGAVMISAEGNSRVVLLKGNIRPHQAEGITKRQYTDELSSYGALMTANPAKIPLLEVFNGSPSGQSSQVCTCVLTLHYTAEFFAPIVLASS